jgi:hypothetical protein
MTTSVFLFSGVRAHKTRKMPCKQALALKPGGFHRNNDSGAKTNNIIFNAQFSGKIAQIKRLRFFIWLTKKRLFLMKRLRVFFCFSLQSTKRKICFPRNLSGRKFRCCSGYERRNEEHFASICKRESY